MDEVLQAAFKQLSCRRTTGTIYCQAGVMGHSYQCGKQCQGTKRKQLENFVAKAIYENLFPRHAPERHCLVAGAKACRVEADTSFWTAAADACKATVLSPFLVMSDVVGVRNRGLLADQSCNPTYRQRSCRQLQRRPSSATNLLFYVEKQEI